MKNLKEQATQNIGTVLSRLAHSRDFEGKMLEQRVFAMWRKVVGPPFANNMHPASLSGGILKVYTEYPLYRTELSFHKEKIIATLNAELGEAVLIDLRLEVRAETGGERTMACTTPNGENALESSSLKKTKHSRKNATHGTHIEALTPDALDAIEPSLSELTEGPLKTSLRQLFMTQSQKKRACRDNTEGGTREG